jgi:hypothetical protein
MNEEISITLFNKIVKDLAFTASLAGRTFNDVESRAITIRKVQKRGDNQLQLGFTLLEGAIEANDVPSQVDADLLIESGSAESGNIAIFENRLDRKNRSYSSPVQFVSLPTRLDVASQRKRAYPNRKRIQEQFQREDVREKIEDKKLFAYFVTPTYKNLIGRDFEESFEFLEEVAKQFRDDDYYQKTFVGAFRKIDFTCGSRRDRMKTNRAFDYRTDGYNFHNHYAVVSSIEFADTTDENETKTDAKLAKRNKKLAKIYTELCKKVHLEMFGEEMQGVSDSGYFRLDIRPIDLTTNGDERKGIAIEMASYLTHSHAFVELEPSELLSANRILKFKKLVSSTGIFNDKKGRQKVSNPNKRKGVIKTNVIKETDATFINRLGSMSKSLSSMSDICKKIAGVNEITPEINREILSSIYELLHEISLKEIGVRLCLSGNRQIWLNILPDLFKAKVMKARQRFLWRFPNAVVTDLQGNVYGEHRRNYTDEELQRNLMPETRHVFGNPTTLH